MRLLFVSNLFPDEQEPYRGLDNATLLHALRGRAEIQTLALRPVLPWSRRRWTPRTEDAPLHPRYVRAIYIPRMGHRWNHLLYARALRRLMTALREETPFDAVLVSWLFPDACAVARLLRGSNTPFVAVAQGTDVHHYLRIPARKKIITAELRDASAIITRSAKLADLLAEAGLAREKLHPIYNGVDSTTFSPASPEMRLAARAVLGISADVPVVLFVGNFVPVKNPSLLISAHTRLVRNAGMQAAHLVLVGGGPLEPALRAQADKAGISHLVIFAGRQNPPGVAEAMHAADVLALSSWNEGLPNVLLEGLSSGIPVVASDVGGISEIINAEHLGALFPAEDETAFADALLRSLTRRPDPEAIIRRASSFSWASAAEAYFRLLRPA